ncbi:MAG: hypothetical protein GX443_10825 [Deltaproteobacteria bacterium]|nr:hypothetical protein [Deltaproteobacteria bacterium]
MRARIIRESMRVHDGGGPRDERERDQALAELDALRRLRADLEKERIAAAEERMRLLGHS